MKTVRCVIVQLRQESNMVPPAGSWVTTCAQCPDIYRFYIVGEDAPFWVEIKRARH
jgi:hypothetical protein